MTIAADSRYIYGDYETVIVASESPTAPPTYNVAVYAGAVVVKNVAISYYIAVDGDRYDKLALRIFGDPTKWWVLADMNPEVTWPGSIPAGTTIRIPLMVNTTGVNILSAGSTLAQSDALSSTRG